MRPDYGVMAAELVAMAHEEHVEEAVDAAELALCRAFTAGLEEAAKFVEAQTFLTTSPTRIAAAIRALAATGEEEG